MTFSHGKRGPVKKEKGHHVEFMWWILEKMRIYFQIQEPAYYSLLFGLFLHMKVFFLIFRNCLFLNILMQLTELCKGNEGEGAGVLTESGDFSKP